MKVKFIVSFELRKNGTEYLPALSEAFEATLERFLLPYSHKFEGQPEKESSVPLHLIYTVEPDIHQANAVFYLGRLIEAEAGILQLFDESVPSFSFRVES